MFPGNQAIVDDPEVFQSLGFCGSGSALGATCLTIDFFVDDTAEIMGTQVFSLFRTVFLVTDRLRFDDPMVGVDRPHKLVITSSALWNISALGGNLLFDVG